jgi:hypothetical protein
MLSGYFDIHMPLTLYPRRGRDISGVSADNLLATYLDIHGRKGEVLFFCSVSDAVRDIAFSSVAITHYSKISLLVMLSWYFDLPEGYIHATDALSPEG